MNATKFAKNVVEKYGTNDIVEIAEKAGAEIVYEN